MIGMKIPHPSDARSGVYQPSNYMKKCFAGGLAVLIVLSGSGMTAVSSRALSSQPSAGDAVCRQQNQGVVVCPSCQGRGTIANQTCRRCQGRGIVKANGMPW